MTRRRPPGSTTRDGYGAEHRRQRDELGLDAEPPPPCHVCGAPATQADHVPPLDLVALMLDLDRRSAARLYSTDGTGPYRLLPACGRCNADAGRRYARLKRGAPPARTVPRLNRSRQW